MLSATLTESSNFKKIIDSIKDLVSQVNLDATSEGLSIQAMDSAHVSLVSLLLKESGFSHYRCDKPITLGINLTDLAKTLKLADNDDELTLKASEDSSYLQIICTNNSNGKESEFQLNLLNIESDALGIPDSEYPTVINLSSSYFVKLCKELSPLTDSLRLVCDSEKELLVSFTGKTGNGKIRIKEHIGDKDDKVSIKHGEDFDATFGIQYLNSFSKASSLSSTVSLNLSTKYPLMITYEIKDLGFIKFYLAPKMDEES